MPSHFSTIGFAVQSREEMYELVQRAAYEGRTIETARGRYVVWGDDNGAELWVQVDPEDTIIGVAPHFSGKARMSVGLIKIISRPNDNVLDGAYYGWADPAEGEPENGAHPFVFDLPDFAVHPNIELPTIVTVQLAAFAHELQAYPSEQAFLTAEKDLKLAPESFLPSGLFTPDLQDTNPPTADAIFAGRVLEHATFVNSITGDKYEWALVHTLGGSVDVVADPVIVQGEIVPTGIIAGAFWMSGRLVLDD